MQGAGELHGGPAAGTEAPRPRVLDVRGAATPRPLLELIAALRGARAGDLVEVLTTDGDATREIPYWAAKQGHAVRKVAQHGAFWRITVQKAGAVQG